VRIVVILSALGAGGAERVVSLLAHEWAQRGHDIAIITFEAPDARSYHRLPANVRAISLGADDAPSSKWSALFRSLSRVARLRRAITAEKPDLVISFLTKINVLTMLACRGMDVPLIVCERNNPLRQGAHPLWWRLHEWLRRGVLVLQTEGSRAALARHSHGAICIIPNPVEPAAHRAAVERKTIVAVGRFVPQKGFDMLLRAFARIAALHPDWSLTIWGEGPERERLEQQRNALGLQERVSFPGLSDRPGGWVESGSVFLLSSLYEGFPNVLAEAMAAGFAVISFDCPWGPGEIIQHDRDGILVPAEDEGVLAAAMAELLADPGRRLQLGEAAARNIRRFSADSVFRQWDELIEGVTAAKQADREPAPSGSAEGAGLAGQ
jgi:glycosyltransferase involved in cell wall biosynthesis